MSDFRANPSGKIVFNLVTPHSFQEYWLGSIRNQVDYLLYQFHDICHIGHLLHVLSDVRIPSSLVTQLFCRRNS